MIAASKRAATAPTVTTLKSPALTGGTIINPTEMSLMMSTNTPMPTLGAITLASGRVVTPDYVLRLETDRRPLRPDEELKFNTWLDDQPVVTRHRVPIYASCRVLAQWGMSGIAAFVLQTGAVSMVIDIAKGAKLTVKEGNDAPTVRKYVPFPAGSVTSARSKAADTDAPKTGEVA